MADFNWVPKELEGRFSYINGRLMASCEVCGATKQTAGRGSVLREIDRDKSDRFRFCSIHGDFAWAKPSREDVASWPVGYKRCRRCLEVKPFSEFHKHSDCLLGINTECKECRLPKSKEHYHSLSFEQRLLHSSRGRATKHGIPHTITLSDIHIPDICPVLGVPIVLERNNIYAPSLDQLTPRKGYTPDNIIVMSRRANVLKNNMTLEEARLLVGFLESHLAANTIR